MNNKTLTLLVILALVAGGLFYLKSRPTKEVSINPDTQSPTEVMTEAQKFAAAVSSGEPYYCEIVSEDTTITYQLKNGKMYMTTVSPEYTGYLINDGEYIYSWSNQSQKGSKMRIPTETSPSPNNTPTFANTEDYQAYEQQGYTLDCRSQAVDDNLFSPPRGITFIDPAAMLKEAMPDGETVDLNKLQEMVPTDD